MEYMFGVRNGKISKRAGEKLDKICKRIASERGRNPRLCGFAYTAIPGDGPKGWFYGENLGHPFDCGFAADVEAAVAAADIH